MKLKTFLKKLYFKIFGIPHVGTRIRFRNVKSLINELIKRKFSPNIILNAGCGSGLYSFYLARIFPNAKIITIDIDKEQIEKNRKNNTFSNIEFIEGDLRKLNFKEKFDLIICIDVLEHIKEDAKVIRNFCQSLKENGLLLIHVSAFPQDYKIFIKEYHQEDHVRDGYSEHELKNLLTNNGFRIIKIQRTFNLFGSFVWDLWVIFYGKNKILFFMVFFFSYTTIEIRCDFSKKEEVNGILILAIKNKLLYNYGFHSKCYNPYL